MQISLRELARQRGVHYLTVKRWTERPNRDGKILKCFREGGSLYTTAEFLEEYRTYNMPEVRYEADPAILRQLETQYGI